MSDRGIREIITRKAVLAQLAERGIHTLEQLSAITIEELQTIHGIGSTTAPRIRAKASAYVEKKPVWFGRVPDTIRKPGAILDVRVDPDTLPQMPWGFCLASPLNDKHYLIDVPEISNARQLRLPDGRNVSLVPRFHSAWSNVLDLAVANDWTIYYWGKAVLKHLNETAPPKVQKDLKRRMVDLHKVFVDAVALPIKSTGLVETAEYLGYTGWTSEDKPFIAHIAYLHWRRNPDRLDSLQDALDTMGRNTDAISHIWWWMCSGYRANS